MYYPIIDKLKTLMTDIASVKAKEPLIIEGTVTSATGGTWVGDWNDIISAFHNNKPVYFKLLVGDITFIIPVISLSDQQADSCILYFNNMTVYGKLSHLNIFTLTPVQ